MESVDLKTIRRARGVKGGCWRYESLHNPSVTPPHEGVKDETLAKGAEGEDPPLEEGKDGTRRAAPLIWEG